MFIKEVKKICREEGITLSKKQVEEMFELLEVEGNLLEDIVTAKYIDGTFVEMFPSVPIEEVTEEYSFDGNRIAKVWIRAEETLVYLSSDGKAEEGFLLF